MVFARITMYNARQRLLLVNFVPPRAANMSWKSSVPSHYETLEVHHHATQNDIKSAFFKLSKQYHPDKNNSEEAIAKFRDVAEAYEILGNYTSRKTYDRSILTKTQYDGSGKHTERKSDDPKIKYYQSHAAVFRDTQKSGSKPIYDFDAWTKAHYGHTFHRTIKDKAQSAKIRQYRTEEIEEKTTMKESAFIFVSMVFAITLWALGMQSTVYDKPPLPLHQAEETLNNNESIEMRSQRSGT